MRILFFLALLMCSCISYAQTYCLQGRVIDKTTSEPLIGVAISIKGTQQGIVTDVDGRYSLCNIAVGEHIILVRSTGYKTLEKTVHVDQNITLDFVTEIDAFSLGEVMVEASWGRNTGYPYMIERIVSYPAEWHRPATNLVEQMKVIPGVFSMDVSPSISKPVLRGLNSNRIAVVNNGVKQQNQQWGADHGMQIGLADLEMLTIVQGVNALRYGSDAMGGVIDVESIDAYSKGFLSSNSEDAFKLSGDVRLWGASNNDQMGAALSTLWRNKRVYVKAAYSYDDYADYRVPVNKFSYQSETFDIHKKRLKNTAGKEQNLSLHTGYKFSESLESFVSVANNQQKHGFFAGGHGLPHAEDLLHDGDFRNIDMPYSKANHLSLTNNTKWKVGEAKFTFSLGYQSNVRKEYEEEHDHEHGHEHATLNLRDAHDDDQNHDNLGIDLRLKTYSAGIEMLLHEKRRWTKALGVSYEFQNNKIGGHEFFLPRYTQRSGGLYFINGFELSNKVKLQAGVRYDIANIDIAEFYDHELEESILNDGHGHTLEEAQQWALKASHVKRNFNGFSGGVGATFKIIDHYKKSLTQKVDVTKSFRYPTAIELASNGEHHGAFRYEMGNSDLKIEEGYTLSTETNFDLRKRFEAYLQLYASYLPSFIYLKPEVGSDHVDESADRVYKNEQARTVVYGGQYSLKYFLITELYLKHSGAYVYNKNRDSKEPLPFTPPLVLKNEITFVKDGFNRKLEAYTFSIQQEWFATQHRFAAGEQRTPSTSLFNLVAGFDYKLNKNVTTNITFQIQNIFDRSYLNHLSFYRPLNIPSAGRSFKLYIKIPFSA